MEKIKNSLIQSRLDRFYISDGLQSFFKRTEIIPGISSDHSAIVLELENNPTFTKGPGYWKFNNKLINDKNFVVMMQNYIHDLQSGPMTSLDCARSKWEYIKYKIKVRCRNYSNEKARESRKRVCCIEKEMKTLETNLMDNESYDRWKLLSIEMEQYYDEKVEKLAFQARCDNYAKV